MNELLKLEQNVKELPLMELDIFTERIRNTLKRVTDHNDKFYGRYPHRDKYGERKSAAPPYLVTRQRYYERVYSILKSEFMRRCNELGINHY